MANPRARIRSGPSLPPAPVARTSTPRRTIGKPHGRKRSIGVYLPATARAALEALATRTGATFGDAAITAINQLPPPDATPDAALTGAVPTRRRPRPRSRLEHPSVVYLLVEPEQAIALRQLADHHHTSVSALVTRALEPSTSGTPTA